MGQPITNCNDSDVETKLTAEDKVGSSNSVDIKIKAGYKFFDVIESSIVAAYGHEWTQEHTFSQDERLKIAPGDEGWLSMAAPIFRDTGDFTVKLGNTTWKLRGVYFDTPDPNRAGMLVADHRKLTTSEYAAAFPHKLPATSS